MGYARNNKTISWGVVFLLIVLFFPVGYVLLFYKIIKDIDGRMKNSKVMKVFGGILFGCGILYAIIANYGESSGVEGSGDIIAFALFLLSMGIFFIALGFLLKRSATKMEQYIEIIDKHGVTSINEIAAMMSTTYDKAIIYIYKLIEKEIIKDAYIDAEQKKIRFPYRERSEANKKLYEQQYAQQAAAQQAAAQQAGGRQATAQQKAAQQAAAQQAAQTVYTVRCRNCGGTTTMKKYEVKECEFCGSAMQLK